MLLGSAALLGACGGPPLQTAPRPRPVGRVTNHVLVISIDGLRPDAIDTFQLPTLQRLKREGSYARDAQTILPSTTLPSHTSMLTGVDVDVHGVTWNEEEMLQRGPVAVPTVFSLAHAAGFSTAAFFGKPKLRHLHVPETLDHVRSPDTRLGALRSADRTVEEVTRHLARTRPNLTFVHFADPDYAGHFFGWMGRAYARAARGTDRALGDLLAYADARFGKGEYTVIVTADHGGHDRGHGTDDPRDTTIPWIVWGEGVRGGRSLDTHVRTTDTAATILWLLGIAAPAAWSGRAVTEAFDATALQTAH
jgi:arylsulfatase A-like enzyme